MDRTGVRLAAIAVLSAACACAGDPAGGGDAGIGPTAAPFRSALIGEPVPRAEPFRLSLTNPGAAPRRALRYRVPGGTRQRTELAIVSTIEVLVAGRRISKVSPPTTEVGFEVAAEPRPGGGYRCSSWITEASSVDWERMAPGRGSELKESLDQLRGHPITFEVDDRGTPVSRAIDLPDRLEKYRAEALQILKSVVGSVMPFPLEPVGVGATWTVVDTDRSGGNLAGAVSITYTLVAMDGDRVELTMAMTLPGDPAPLALSGAEVAGYASGVTDGAMRMTLDLTRIMPVEFAGEIKSEIEGRTFVGSEVLPFKALTSTRERLQSR